MKSTSAVQFIRAAGFYEGARENGHREPARSRDAFGALGRGDTKRSGVLPGVPRWLGNGPIPAGLDVVISYVGTLKSLANNLPRIAR